VAGSIPHARQIAGDWASDTPDITNMGSGIVGWLLLLL